MYSLLRSALFRLDPETSHTLALQALDGVARVHLDRLAFGEMARARCG